MCTDEPVAYVAPALLVLITHVCVIGIVLEFAARCQLFDILDVCNGDLNNLLCNYYNFPFNVSSRN